MNEKISRSEQKRQHKQLEDAAKEISELGDQELKRFPGSEELKVEIALSRKAKGGARKRQIKYIAKILKSENQEEILQFLQKEKGSKIELNLFHHEIERFRDSIINQALKAYDDCRQKREAWEINFESHAINQLVDAFPAIDELEIRRAVHQYVRNRNKTYYRELFRLIKSAAEKYRLSQKMNG